MKHLIRIARAVSGTPTAVLVGPVRPATKGLETGLFFVSRPGVVDAPPPYDASGEDVVHQVGLESVVGDDGTLALWSAVSVDGFEVTTDEDMAALAALVGELTAQESAEAAEFETNFDWA